MPPPLVESRPYLIDLVMLSVLLGLAWGRFLFGDSVLYSGDTFYYFYPLRHTLFTALQTGYLPDWESTALSGNPFCANPQANCYYPLSLWFFWSDFLKAYQWSVVSHLLVGGAGVYVWLRGRRHSRLAAMLATMVFTMGGPTLSMINRLDKLESLSWWPWAMFGLEQVLRRRPGGLSLLTLALALQLLAGGLEVWGMTVGALFLWGALVPPDREAVKRDSVEATDPVTPAGASPGMPTADPATRIAGVPTTSPRATLVTVAVLAATLLLCAMVTAPQWITFRELLEHSSRSSGMNYEKAIALSLRPADLWGVLFPHLFYNPATEGFHPTAVGPAESRYFLGLYLGWLPVLAMLWAMSSVLRRGADGATVRCALLIIGVSLLLASGGHNPLYRPLFEALPPLRAIRYPEKFLSLAAFFALPLLAVGIERWRAGPRGLFVAASLGVALCFILFFVPGPVLRLGAVLMSWSAGGAPEAWWEKLLSLRPQLWLQALVLMTAGGMGLLQARGLLRESVALPLLVSLVGFDLWSGGWALNPPMNAETLRTPPQLAAQLGTLGPEPRVHVLSLYGASPMPPAPGATPLEAYTWLWESLYPNTGQLSGFSYVDGARAVRLDLPTRFFARLRGASLDQQLRMAVVAGIDAVVATPAQHAALEQSPLVAALDFLPARGLSLWRLKSTVPGAYVVRDAVPFLSSLEALDGLLEGRYPAPLVVGIVATSPKTERAQLAPTIASNRSRGGRGNAAPQVLTSRGGAHRVITLTESQEHGYLVLPEAWYPGWAARVDDHPVPVLQANGYQMAVALSAGARRVELEYSPTHRSVAAYVSVFGLLLLGGLWFLEKRRADKVG